MRKYVVTENVTQTVPVQREEVRVEREPITDANLADAGPAISEEEHEVVPHEERPVVKKEAVPVERVRSATDTVTEEAPSLKMCAWKRSPKLLIAPIAEGSTSRAGRGGYANEHCGESIERS